MTPTKLLGLLLVIVSVVALKVLAVLDIRAVFEHRLLLPLLNTLFAGFVPIAVAYVASKAYVKGGSVTIVFMGCGMLSFGLCAIFAGWLIRASDGANLNVTVYNTGAFCGSLFHTIGAMLGLIGTGYSDDIRQRRLRVVLAYIGVTLFVTCFSLAALRGMVPPFFIQGAGPTELRQAILGSSVLLYSVSSIFLMAHYVKRKSDFPYWYSLCLAMIAIGLFAFFVQRSVGSPIGWLGRSANYVGGIFALIAILGALREARVKRVSLERSIADDFGGGEASYWRWLIPVLPIPIFLFLLVIIVSTDLRTVFEPPGLFAALNTLFLTVFPLSIAFFATRGYLQSGLFTMLMLGSGTLTLGLGSILSGWMLTWQNGGPNAGVTILNLFFLLAATFHLLGGVSGFIGVRAKKDTRHKTLAVALTYIGIAVLAALLTNMILKGLIPVFFVPGQGFTMLRQAVLGTSTILFSISGLLLLSLYLFSRTKLLYWYTLALFLLSTGLICYISAKSVGDPIAWLGRISLYLAGTYLLIAVLSAAKDLRTKGVSLEEGISNLFRHHLESLVEERTLQLQSAHNELERANAELSQTNQRLQALMEALPVGVSFSDDTSCQRITGNPCLFAQFEITPEDNISASAPYPTDPGRLVRFFHNGREIRDNELPLQRAVAENEAIPPIELEVHHRSGLRWVAEVSGAPIRDDQGNVVGGVAVTLDITDRKKREEELRKSEERNRFLAQVLEFSSQPFGVGHLDGSIGMANKAYCDLVGYSEEEMRQADWAKGLTPPEHRELESAKLAELIATGKPVRYEKEYIRKDGNRVPVELLVHTVTNESGDPLYYSFITDLTERKQTEMALLMGRAKLETALESMTDAVFISDVEGNFIEFNEAFATFHKFRNKEECAKTLAEYPEFLDVFMSNGDLAPLEQWAVPRALRGETVMNAEYALKRKDTGETWVGSYSFAPIRDRSGVIVGSVVAGRDITEQKRMEQALQKAHDELELRVQERTAELEKAKEAIAAERQRLYDILETMPDMVCLLTPDYHYAFTNRSFREKFGDHNGRHCFDLVFGKNEPCEFCEAYTVLETGKPHFWVVETSDGSVIDVYNFPFADVDGSPLILEIDVDITEQRRAEESLRASEERFRRIFEQGQFGVEVLGLDGRYLMVNPRFCELLGYSEIDFAKKIFNEITHPDDIASEDEMVQKLLNGKIDYRLLN